MQTTQYLWEKESGWDSYGTTNKLNPQLVLFFGSTEALSDSRRFEEISEMFPNATLVGCSTAGEIIGDEVFDDSIVATAIEFQKTPIRVATLLIDTMASSYAAGLQLAQELKGDDLRGVFIISDGQTVNGSDLVEGLAELLGQNVIITGGLAGDGARFEKTLVSCNGAPEPGRIVAIGLYGDAIRIGHGSVGGWDSFGPERKITRSEANVLLELDGKPALQLYKQYLGEQAEELPGSALLFPLMIRPGTQASTTGTVRTILSVSETANSMTFAGNVPEGYTAQLMMANFDQLIDGAAAAADHALMGSLSADSETLAILVSCVGRKMVLGQRIGDEVESVQEILGSNTRQIGFYSYGEISPHVEMGNCQLHNQTMTITAISEIL
jgi:hypothetical protein